MFSNTLIKYPVPSESVLGRFECFDEDRRVVFDGSATDGEGEFTISCNECCLSSPSATVAVDIVSARFISSNASFAPFWKESHLSISPVATRRFPCVSLCLINGDKNWSCL